MKKIKVKGVIVPNDYKEVYDFFGIESTSPYDIESVLKNAEREPVEVTVNSGGGDVWSGSEIYSALKEHEGEVTVKITGLAASAASVIAMAGDKVLMSPTAEFMIHNASSLQVGDNRDMEHMAGVLATTNKVVANAYILKTGRSQSELLEMMNKETWLTAQEAKKYGFIDEVMYDNQMQLVASAGRISNVLPPEVIQKFKNDKLEKKPDPKKDEVIFMQSKLNLLKLGGIQNDI